MTRKKTHEYRATVAARFTTTVRAETRAQACRIARRRLLAQGMAPDPNRAWRLIEEPLARIRLHDWSETAAKDAGAGET